MHDNIATFWVRRALTCGSILVLAGGLWACKEGGDESGETKDKKAVVPSEADAPPAAKPGSCDTRSDTGVCTDSKEASPDVCTAMGGIASDTPCPQEGVVGSCTLGEGEVKHYYSTGGVGYTAASGKEACINFQQGTWKAAPGADSGSDTPAVGACTVEADKSCSETKLNNPGDAETYAKQCAEISAGTWAEGPCPTKDIVGECNSAAAGRTVYYKGAEDPKHACEQFVMGGVYTPAGS